MILIWLTHALYASTFTLTKIALNYISPFALISIRFIVGGGALLGGYLLMSKQATEIRAHFWWYAVNLSLFIAYIPFACEFWGLQFLSSSKACLLYNLAPFVTAILSFILLGERLTKKQWIGLVIGFIGFIPILATQTNTEEMWQVTSYISLPELVLIVAVITNSYGWIVIQRAQQVDGYSPYFLNGVAMLGGGLLALTQIMLFEGIPALSSFDWHNLVYLEEAFYISVSALTVISTACCLMYTLLVARYTATFIAFTAFTTPLFTALLGYFFLCEKIGIPFMATMLIVFCGLYLFYQDEIK